MMVGKMGTNWRKRTGASSRTRSKAMDAGGIVVALLRSSTFASSYSTRQTPLPQIKYRLRMRSQSGERKKPDLTEVRQIEE